MKTNVRARPFYWISGWLSLTTFLPLHKIKILLSLISIFGDWIRDWSRIRFFFVRIHWFYEFLIFERIQCHTASTQERLPIVAYYLLHILFENVWNTLWFSWNVPHGVWVCHKYGIHCLNDLCCKIHIRGLLGFENPSSSSCRNIPFIVSMTTFRLRFSIHCKMISFM